MPLLRSAFPAALTIACLLALGLPALATDEAGESQEQDFREPVDLTFPTAEPSARTPIERVDGTSYGFVDDYHHARGNDCQVHRATDIFGAAGQPVHAAVGGEITFMPEQVQRYGWMIRIAAEDGRTYNYIHLGHQQGTRAGAYAEGLSVGDEVERGQHIGYLGSSGNASDELPHLHFEIRDEAVAESADGCPYRNPFASLELAVERGDLPPETAHAAEVGPARAAVEVDRIAGRERVGTAAALSRDAYPEGADHVVLAAAESFPDSIVAGPLAAALEGPVLTTYGSGLHPDAREELERLGAEAVTVIDGDGLLEGRVLDDLVEAGIDRAAIEHLKADSPAAVAAMVAERVWELQRTRDALIALGSHPEEHRAWPDALTAGYHGAVSGLPVLLVDPDVVPEATLSALDRVSMATIVGGPAAVSEELADEIAEEADAVRRLHGRNRFETAAAVADDLLRAGLVEIDRVWAATGRNFADALTAAGAVAAAGEVLVLVDGLAEDGDASIDPWLRDRADDISRGRVIGGAAAVNEDARALHAERIR